MNACWDWEPAAMRGEPVPERLGSVDKLAYLSIQGLYARYRAGHLTAEQAKQEKAEIRKLHQYSVDTFKTREAYFKAVLAMLADTEELRRRMRTAQTAMDVALLGLNLCAVIDGRVTLTGYDAFVKVCKLCGMEDSLPRQIDLSGEESVKEDGTRVSA